MFNILGIILIALTVSACSPFGNQSMIEEISTTISNIFDGKTSPSLISGSTSYEVSTTPTTGTTNPDGIPVSGSVTYVDGARQGYKVTQTVGEPYQYSMESSGGASVAPAMKTATDAYTHTDTGYKVYSTVSTIK